MSLIIMLFKIWCSTPGFPLKLIIVKGMIGLLALVNSFLECYFISQLPLTYLNEIRVFYDALFLETLCRILLLFHKKCSFKHLKL